MLNGQCSTFIIQHSAFHIKKTTPMIILSTAPILPIFNLAIADYHKFDDVDHHC